MLRKWKKSFAAERLKEVIAVDTNVLIRVLVNDPGQVEQVEKARKLIREAEQVYVPQIVQVETVWVLESAYGLKKAETLRILNHLIWNRAFILQREDRFQEAVDAYSEGSADFSDYLILSESLSEGLNLATFDKQLSKTAGVIRIR